MNPEAFQTLAHVDALKAENVYGVSRLDEIVAEYRLKAKERAAFMRRELQTDPDHYSQRGREEMEMLEAL